MNQLEKQFMEAYSKYTISSFALIAQLASCLDPKLDPVRKEQVDRMFNDTADRMDELVEVGKKLDKKVSFPVILAN